MPDGPAYAAIDLGASSGPGRGRPAGRRPRRRSRSCTASPTAPCALPTGLRWNLLHLFTEALDGLRRVAGALARDRRRHVGRRLRAARRDGNLLGLPFHYRDGRTEGMAERAFERVSRRSCTPSTGIQTMPINTVFQLLADEDSAALAAAAGDRAHPRSARLLALRRAGQRVHAASTTGLLDARTGQWALGSSSGWAFRRPVRRRRRARDAARGLRSPITSWAPVPVYSVAGHDTASAFAAAPVRDPHAASCRAGRGACSASSSTSRCSPMRPARPT